MIAEQLKNHSFRGMRIPEYMHRGIIQWVEYGIQPGSFLQSIILDNLSIAISLADYENLHNIPAYIDFFNNYAPAQCWGSMKNFDEWKGLINLK